MEVLIFDFTMGFIFGMVLTGCILTVVDKIKERSNIND